MNTRKQSPLDTTGQLHKSSASVTPFTSQKRKPCMEREGGHEVPPPAKELLATDSCWKTGASFL